MQVTRRHRRARYLTTLDIEARFYDLNFEEKYDPAMVRDLAQAYSHIIAGEYVEDSFLSTEEVLGEKPRNPKHLERWEKDKEYNENFQKFLSDVDWDLFTGNTPLAKAASIITALTHNNKFEFLSNEEIKEMKERQKKEKEEKAKEEEEKKKQREEAKKKRQEKREQQKGKKKEVKQVKAEDKNGDEGEDGEGEGQGKGKFKKGENGEEGEGSANVRLGGSGGSGEDDDDDSEEIDLLGESDWDFDKQLSGDVHTHEGEDGRLSDSDIDIEETEEERNDRTSPREMMLKMFEKIQTMEHVQRTLHDGMRQIVEASEGIMRHVINPRGDAAEIAMHKLNNHQKTLLKNMAILASRGAIKAHRKPKERRVTSMTDVSQLPMLNSMASLLMPTFKLKLARRELLVRKDTPDKKQMLILLIDDSGSMQTEQKMMWVKSLLYDRLDAVARGEGILYITMFVNNCDLANTLCIKDKRDAVALIKTGWMPSFNGGGTDIERAVREMCLCIKTGRIGKHRLEGENPQIVVINDGQDTVNGKYKPDVITHGFILGQDNDGMRNMISNNNDMLNENNRTELPIETRKLQENMDIKYRPESSLINNDDKDDIYEKLDNDDIDSIHIEIDINEKLNILIDEKDVPKEFFIDKKDYPKWEYLKGSKNEKRTGKNPSVLPSGVGYR